jgi:hypothetical protein
LKAVLHPASVVARKGCPNQKERPPTTTIPRPGVVSTSTGLEAEDLPEQVTVALRELADAVKEGLLAFRSASA